MKKKDRISELKKELDKRKVNEIVGEIHDEVNRSRKAVIRKVELLYYLERTSRFKELDEYKGSTFYLFIQYEFNLLPGTYEKERRAVFGYRERCEQFGVGYVAKVIGRTVSPEKVFKEINGEAKRSKKPLQRQRLEEIFEKHKKPDPPKVITPKVCDQCEKYKAEIRLLNKEINELKEQVAKLKGAIRKRDQVLDNMRGVIVPFYEDRPTVSA